jgi:hypothetical protein
MIVLRVYVYIIALGTIRAPGRKGVSLHRASRHAVTDVIPSIYYTLAPHYVENMKKLCFGL